MAKTIDFQQILQDEASFQIVRTNPKLTGNVKLTVDSNDKMWLNSIDANEELSKSIYKRFAVDPNMSLPGNMFSFFDSGRTPSEIVFDMSESFDSTKTSSDFKDQYDFDHYFSGVQYLPSRRYTEKLSYFAPIYLKEDVPEYFVIFKIKDPLNHTIMDMEEAYPYDKETYIKDLFKKSTIIKTFDLRPTTRVGSFLRNHVNDINFPSNPLSVSYEEDVLTEFNGILYNSGVFGSRGEDLHDFFQSSNPLKYSEEFITLGFERNGVIFPNIINMEFIFDDTTSDLYDFNRYVGMYVNAIELSKCDIDLNRGFKERGDWENTPRFRREYFEYEATTLNQSNDNGVVIPITNLDIYMSDFKDIFTDKNNMFFNYITDKNNNIHLPSLDLPYSIDYEGPTEMLSGKIKLSNTTLELGDMFGPGEIFIQDKGVTDNDRGFSHSYIKIESLEHLDSFKLYHPHGTRSDSNGKYELIEAVSGFVETPYPADFYFFHDIDNTNGNDTFYFNADGSKLENAIALAGCINKIRRGSIKAFVYNEYVIIRCNTAGDYDNLYSLEFASQLFNYSGITINDITGSDLIGLTSNFEGGCIMTGHRLIIDYSHYEKIKSRIDDILVKTVNGWSKIKKISKYIDPITEANTKTAKTRKYAISEFFGKMSVDLALEILPSVDSGDFIMTLKHRPSFGLLSFFPIKDFDFDFYSSEYLNFPKVDLYEHYYIPPNMKAMHVGLKYKIYGSGTIMINGIELTAPTQYEVIAITSDPGPYAYSIISGDVIVEVLGEDSIPGNSYWNAIDDDNKELTEFPGFFLLKDPDKVIPEVDEDLSQSYMLYSRRDKYLNGIANSEYDFYKENSTKDFALKSKVIPYITKWVYPDGLDCRSNPYRLNTELVFGFNNFAPDHDDTSQNPANFTHEWFYIESKFRYTEDESTVKLNNSYFPEPFDLNQALTEDGYFIDYFTYTPTFNSNEVNRTQTRYSPIRKNKLGIYETFFKGFKIQFKDYIDATNLNEAGKPEFNINSSKYDGFKFTTLLKPIKEDINDDTTPPIRYRFIEHEEFKFIILLIEVSIGYQESIDEYWSREHVGSPDHHQYNGITNEDTSLDLNFLATIPGTLTQSYDSINGDYRIKFDDINGLDISNLTHTLLYSLKHKKFNNIDNNFSNIKLSTKLSFKYAFSNGSYTIPNVNNTNIPNYPSDIRDEIKVISAKTFIIGYNSYIDMFIDAIDGFTPMSTNNIEYAESTSVTYIDVSSIPNRSYGIVATDGVLQQYLSNSISDNTIMNQWTFKVMSGGELYFETLFEKLAFGKFKDTLNNLDSFIEYETYSYSDSMLSSKTPSMYTEIPDISTVTKTDAIITQIDSNKPSNLAFNKLIGFTYERSKLDNSYEINRYDGGFTPLFKDVFSFNSKFNFIKNDIKSLDLSNTRFNIDIDNFLQISNFNHIKVATTKILDLENNEEFEPRYEIADEIAIGHSDYNLFTSNWDFGFHHRYVNKKTKTPVSGTLRIEEDDSFISKIITLRDTIELENFKIDIVKNVKRSNIDNYEILYTETDQSIKGKINIKNAIISYLLTDGIGAKFTEFLDNSPRYIGNFKNIEDYVKEYINLNITKLYEITEIELYSKDDRTLANSANKSFKNSIKFEFLNDTERFNSGYKLDRNIEINKLDRFTLSFEINKAVTSGKLVSPKIKIKFI